MKKNKSKQNKSKQNKSTQNNEEKMKKYEKRNKFQNRQTKGSTFQMGFAECFGPS